MLAVTIRSKSQRGGGISQRRPFSNGKDHRRSNDRANDLKDYVKGRIGGADLLREKGSDRDSGIDVTSGNRTDGVSHGQHSKAKRQRHTDISNFSTRQNRTSNTAYYQYKSPDHFCQVELHVELLRPEIATFRISIIRRERLRLLKRTAFPGLVQPTIHVVARLRKRVRQLFP